MLIPQPSEDAADASFDSTSESLGEVVGRTDSEALATDPRLIDDIFEHGMDRKRAHNNALGRILGTLDGVAPACDPSLTDLAMLRIRRHAGVQREMAAVVSNRDVTPTLGEDDRDALDALILAGFDPSRVPGALRARAQRHRALGAIVSQTPGVRASEDLSERVLDAIARAQEPIRLEARRMRIRLADLVSIAALLLIGASLVLPVVGAVRDQQNQAMCANNMLASALGLSNYAADNDGSLPVVSAGFSGGPWWNVGDPRSSNSANLFLLARGQYVAMDDLACAGNRLAPTLLADASARDWRGLDEVSYAYRIMRGGRAAHWSEPRRFVVMSDRSPVVVRAVRGYAIDPRENSPNHEGRGQEILLSDGSVRWLDSPMVTARDNLWLPRPIEDAIRRFEGEAPADTLSGYESPASLEDAFVGP